MPVSKLRNILIISALLLFIANFLQAAYLHNMPVNVVQPDGTKLELLASGDEFHNWLHDKNNFTIIRNPETGYFCYAIPDGENVKAGRLVVGQGDPASIGITAGVNISTNAYKQLRSSRFPAPAERDAPTTGLINNLVIYIRFSDETEFGQSNSIYDGWFNSGTSSLKTYFQEASYSQLTVNTSFYPAPVSGNVVSWQDSHPRSYFQPYNASTNPGGYDGDDQRRSREFTLLQNAVAGVASQIPSSLTIDSDGDGRVDNVVFIVKGAAGAWSSLLWPHRWSLYDRYVYINGKRVYDFNFQLQTFLSSRGVGVICHEFFHTLGAPDLYHYTDNGIDPAGSWDIMESDQNPPQHMTAFMKWKYGDWISSIPTITADGVYTLNPLTSSTGQAYKINSNNANQYYIVEFRKDTGTFESSIPGSGLLIYRIDTSCGNGNADGPPDELYIYRPNGTTTVNGTLSSAHFSSETGRIKIDNTTNPTPFLQDGSAGNLYLCEIGSSAGTTMSFRKGAPFIDFSQNPYAQGFDATYFPPDGWAKDAVSGTYQFERVTSGTNPTCSPKAGSAMLRYNSDVAPSGNAAYISTPRIVCNDLATYGYRTSFWMYRDGNQVSLQDKLEIYLNTSQNLSGSPVLLGTIYRNRTLPPAVSPLGWYQYSFSLPVSTAGNYYVVFKATSASGYNIFLDSVEISRFVLPPNPAISPSPADLATDVPWTQILSWASGGQNPSGYKLYLGTNNPPTNHINGQDLGNVSTYTPQGLRMSTQYFWKVVPYNSGGDAPNCPVWSFNTIADYSVFPLSEGFGSSGTAFPPSNWTRYSGVLADPTTLTATTSYWGQDDWLNAVTNPPNYAARMNIYSTRNAWLISPLLDIPASAMLSFDLGLTDYANSNPISSDPNGLSGSDDQFIVLVSDGRSWNNANIVRKWDNAGSAYVYNQISPSGQRIFLDLSAYPGYKQIAFYGASSVSNADNDLFVDNISVQLASPTAQLVAQPVSWNAGTVLINTSTTKLVTLTNTGLAALSLSGITLSGSTAFALSGVPGLPVSLALGQSISFNVLFSPLAAGSFSAILNLNDNRTNTQIPLSGLGFDARISTLPQTQDFDSVLAPALPLGWTAVVSSSSTSATVVTSGSNPHSYPNTCYFSNSTDTAADLRLISPELLLPMQILRVKFSARGSSAGYILLAGTVDSPSGTFNQLASFTLSDVHSQYEFSLAGYGGTDHFIAFKHGLGGSSRSIYLDDIQIEELLSNDMMLSNFSAGSLGVVGQPVSYSVTVTNNGLSTQSSYSVALYGTQTRLELARLNVSDALLPNSSATHVLSWIPASSQNIGVYATVLLSGDSYVGNNSSGSVQTYIYPETTALPEISDEPSQATANTLPLDFYYKNSISETIYLAGELQLLAGNILGVAYKNSFVQHLANMPVKVWLKNSAETNLSSGWLSSDGYTLVFDGTISFPLGINQVYIPFSQPFAYTGGNLAIRINRPMDSVYYSANNHFYYFPDSLNPSRSRYLYSDSTVYDPLVPSAAGTLTSNIPITTFVVGDYVPQALAVPVVAISSSEGQLQLSWNAVQGANLYKVYSTDNPTQWPDTPLANVSQTTFAVTSAANRKFFKVIAVHQAPR